MLLQGRDVVVLLPGFFGFSRFGGFSYFAERVVATLRGALEPYLGRHVPVVALGTDPTASLADRQRELLGDLRALVGGRSNLRLHLVGHSTGGVDGYLLLCGRPEGQPRGSWDRRDEAIREQIRTVVTISAPHRGTCLAVGRGAQWFEHPLLRLGWSRLPLKLAGDAVLGHAHDLWTPGAVTEAVLGASLNLGQILRFAWRIARSRALVADLTPASREAALALNERDPSIRARMRCFVTVVPRVAAHSQETLADPVFHDLYGLTADERGARQSKEVSAQAEVITRALGDPALVVGSESARACTSEVATSDNDAIVNTARQLVGLDREELAGVVLGDHADVIGHYPWQDRLSTDLAGTRPLNTGLLHSGAGFGDDEFFDLYERVAQEIVLGTDAGASGDMMKSSGPRSRTGPDVDMRRTSAGTRHLPERPRYPGRGAGVRGLRALSSR